MKQAKTRERKQQHSWNENDREALSEGLNKRLAAYALAAGMAGVGIAAMAPPAEANTIVSHTAAFSIVPDGGEQLLTLANGKQLGFNDFAVGSVQELRQSGGNLRVIRSSGGFVSNLDLRHLNPVIGPGRSFTSPDNIAVHDFAGTFGLWANRGYGYFGFEFTSHAKSYFGWAKMSITETANHEFGGKLTEYAYNTLPGQSITAGQTANGSTQPTPEPSTLSLLALGALGLGLWRRRMQASRPRVQASGR